MGKIYDQLLQNVEISHKSFAARVTQPRAVPFGDRYVFRYLEHDIHQALVQKLARVLSGLHAARLLLAHGYLQELGALKRMLDEFNEDIVFLAHGAIYGETTELHKEYLDAFFQEELDDPSSAIKSTQKRGMVRRQRITAYLARIDGAGFNPSQNIEASRTLHKMFGGFVHGASPHIMEMYYGTPPSFHVRETRGTSLTDHGEDLWNYFYRSIVSFACAAKAFGDEAQYQSILKI